MLPIQEIFFGRGGVGEVDSRGEYRLCCCSLKTQLLSEWLYGDCFVVVVVIVVLVVVVFPAVC